MQQSITREATPLGNQDTLGGQDTATNLKILLKTPATASFNA